MFGWLRRKKTTICGIPAESREQAWEYQQVAGLLCLDIDVLVTVCEAKGTTAEEMLWQIRDLRDKKNKIISDKVTRQNRYAAASMLFAAASK